MEKNKQLNSMLIIGGYTRVSKEEKISKGKSLKAQSERIIEWCKLNNYKLYRIYIDDGRTGTNTKRDEFQQLLKDGKDGLFNAIAIVDQDRLSREPRDIDDFLNFLRKDLKGDNKNKFAEIDYGGWIDINDPDQELIIGIKSQFSRREVKKTKQRVERIIEKNLRDNIIQQRLPFGYYKRKIKVGSREVIISKKPLVDKKKAEIIKKLFEDYSNGVSIADLNRKYEFNMNVIKDRLTNIFYTGCFIYRKQIYRDTHKSIISEELFDKVQEKLKS